jgi:hypothetical protein
MKYFASIIAGLLCVLVSPASTQIVETHEFGSTNTQYFIYSDGKTFKFAAQNSMTVKTVEVKSWLASNIPANFHIEVSIQDSLTDSLIAKWDQSVNRDATYREYYHSKQVLYSLSQGDSVVYKIYGNSFWTPEGGLRGVNFVRLTGEKAVGVEFAHSAPQEFLLSQNYPNPFNSTAVIRYGLRRSSHVTLVVYNALGQTVANLVDGEMGPGYYEVPFHADRLASGVYYYRITAGEFVQTRKLLLAK